MLLGCCYTPLTCKNCKSSFILSQFINDDFDVRKCMFHECSKVNVDGIAANCPKCGKGLFWTWGYIQKKEAEFLEKHGKEIDEYSFINFQISDENANQKSENETKLTKEELEELEEKQARQFYEEQEKKFDLPF